MPDLRAKAIPYAQTKVKEKFQESQLADRIEEFPKFSPSEVSKGKVLGKGGFGTVWEIKGFPIVADVREDDSENGRSFLANHARRDNGDCRYAIKQLSPEVVADDGRYIQGLLDLALESRFLSDLEHPNICKLRGMGATLDETFFLILDRLYDTLEHRIHQWERRDLNGIAKRLRDPKGVKADALYEERLVAAFDLAAALQYLHERNILYRDLKPENIGFDIRNDIKLFDFGLARELTSALTPSPDGTYMLTEMTGSPRYMAPEVALGMPYNLTCDVYSFGLLLWQMMTLTTPFELYTTKMMRERVWGGIEKRPFLGPGIKSLHSLLESCWTSDLALRHSMRETVACLKRECVKCRNGVDDNRLEHSRRRSTFVFRPKP